MTDHAYFNMFQDVLTVPADDFSCLILFLTYFMVKYSNLFERIITKQASYKTMKQVAYKFLKQLNDLPAQ